MVRGKEREREREEAGREGGRGSVIGLSERLTGAVGADCVAREPQQQ